MKVSGPTQRYVIPEACQFCSEKRDGSGCAIGCGLMHLFAPVMYVPSIGPIALMVEGNDSLRWSGVIYYLLGMLADLCEPANYALSRHMELWTG